MTEDRSEKLGWNIHPEWPGVEILGAALRKPNTINGNAQWRLLEVL
jgi:hypothetical protein